MYALRASRESSRAVCCSDDIFCGSPPIKMLFNTELAIARPIAPPDCITHQVKVEGRFQPYAYCSSKTERADPVSLNELENCQECAYFLAPVITARSSVDPEACASTKA